MQEVGGDSLSSSGPESAPGGGQESREGLRQEDDCLGGLSEPGRVSAHKSDPRTRTGGDLWPHPSSAQ